MQLFAEGKCRPVNRTETCQKEMWGGLSFDMYNVFRNAVHELRLVGTPDSQRVQEAGTLVAITLA